ncbi:GspH/FimT family pseudopilin [Jeongeupia chitinilytica]|uniref:Type II secretion system protein H n=1 Tax=Jeongeupia chitinilytica TaxID=1041641 RepID=A0ABQ3H1B6_9NEIS|nr:GspH/FimT family pseudopilin [Jeongeupia chitinilytica]GHD63023.1 type II secretion system protein GspH [Jeongeupia chitinilytica]
MHRRRGFTLVEILVALAIVGLILGLAVVRLNDSDATTLSRESERLALLLDSARDAAINSGRATAWSSDGHGYQFWLLDDQNSWRAIGADETLRARQLPEGIRVNALTINLRERPIGERIVFEPSGVNAPFRMELQLGEARWQLDGDAMGRVSARAVEAANG